MKWVGTALLCASCFGCVEREDQTHATSSRRASPTDAASSATPPKPQALPSSPARTASAAASASAAAIDSKLAGRWSGQSSIYSPGEDGAKNPKRYQAAIVVVPDGSFRLDFSREKGLVNCRATGTLSTKKKGRLAFDIKQSDCAFGKAGETAEVEFEWVNPCMAQWNTVQGQMPYEVKQMPFKKERCDPSK